MSALTAYKPSAILHNIVRSMHIGYRQHLKKGRIFLLQGKLLLLKPINMDTTLISLIIVPASIRFKLFDHYHTGPIIGHMGGGYNTLYKLGLRFFWPGLREMIKKLVASCAHYVNYNV